MGCDCILYAEDDPNDVFFIKHAFAKVGVANPLQTVKDGQAAIQYLAGEGAFADRRRYPLPCLVLLDIKMPRATGFDVLHWMQDQRHLRNIPVIIFSASAFPFDIERAYELGANAYVVKPVTVAERLAFAEAIHRFWLHLRYPPPGLRAQKLAA